ncbi:MAG: AAA family ATPase [Pseudomonadota bacterium]
MAAAYVKDILAEKAGVEFPENSDLDSTLDELFSTFFPDKKFLGPRPQKDGSLRFPVEISEVGTHDLDELSSGEKEIIYGYLRIRNSAPRYSVILLDEPELHLNPRLIRELPNFYHKKLGLASNNQVWLVTHSVALLRRTVKSTEYSVYHMLPCNQIKENEPQIKQLQLNADLENALIDLVGDLASFHPSGKTILLEGGGDSEFDKMMVSRLFPEVLSVGNLIPSGNKMKAMSLLEVLENASETEKVPFQFYAITDLDRDDKTSSSVRWFTWGVYHIENFLLEEKYIHKALTDININSFKSDYEVQQALKSSARKSIELSVRSELSKFAHREIQAKVNTRISGDSEDFAGELHDSISNMTKDLLQQKDERFSLANLRAQEEKIRESFTSALLSEDWKKTFRGRDVLRQFVSEHLDIKYDVFCNLIIARMKDDEFQPAGMKEIITRIIQDG